MHWQGTVLMIDHRWGAIVTPADPLYFLRWSWRAVATLVVGLTITAMIVAYLLVWIRRSIHLELLTEQITKMARHDALTGLPNRVLFREKMDEAVERLRRDVPFALLGLDLDQFKAVNDRLGHADLALYDAKEAGRGTFRFFEARLRTRIETQRTLEHDLRCALERCELEVHYQPIINLAQNRVAGFEAFVRWNHPDHGVISPDEFIPLAEERGLIVPLGLWVLKTACEQAAHWPAPVKVAVNISPVQLKTEGLLKHILQCLATSGLPPERLEIEITEAAVLQDSSTTLELLDNLRALGVAVAFDDFGTGFSSLSSVLRFPFDKIKIDRSFIAGIETSPNAAAIVRAIAGLGISLGLATTGEGVETREQLTRLRESGCTEVQGYFFSPARPNCDVPHLLQLFDAKTIHATHASVA